MSQDANVQRIGAYAWCLILAVAGGALIIGGLRGSPGEEPATMLVEAGTRSPTTTASPDGEFDPEGSGAGISPVSNTE